MATRTYKRLNPRSPIVSYNLIVAKTKGRSDKVIVQYGANRSPNVRYTYTPKSIGRGAFDSLVGYLQYGRWAARFINHIMHGHPFTKKGGAPIDKTDRPFKHVAKRKVRG